MMQKWDAFVATMVAFIAVIICTTVVLVTYIDDHKPSQDRTTHVIILQCEEHFAVMMNPLCRGDFGGDK